LADPPTIRSSDRTHVLAVWRGHVLGVWDERPHVHAARRFEALLLELLEAQPGRTAYLAMLPATLALPDADVRDAFARAGQRAGQRLTCIAAVVEGAGFRAASVRAMVTGIGLMARARFPLRCFASLDEAARWAASELERAGGRLGTPAEVAEAFAPLRAQMREASLRGAVSPP
jgi:hypothetical protein